MLGLKRRIILALLCVVGTLPAAAYAEQPTPVTAKSEEVGLSSAQFTRLEAATEQNIKDGLIPSAVMLVARRGKVAWVSVQAGRRPIPTHR